MADKIVLVKLLDHVILPMRRTFGAAGRDVCIPNRVVVGANKSAKIPLGFAIASLPYRSYLQFVLRSSWSNIGLMLVGGVIDEDYLNQQIFVNLRNTSKTNNFGCKYCRVSSNLYKV